MDRLLQSFRDYPAVVGIGFFVFISVFLAVLLGSLMHRAGLSLKPLVFFFGFLAIVGVPQASVHLLDALAHRRAMSAAGNPIPRTDGPKNATPPVGALQPVPWETVFGPSADPSLMTDAKRGLDAILGEAVEAKLSFSAAGESALAARFPTVEAAAAAVNRYGTFFQFAQVTGSDAEGWTARRYQGQGEWNHVVSAGRELYAWTGPSRESVTTPRVRALGPLNALATSAAASTTVSKTQVSTRLSKNLPVMSAFLGINLVLAVGWFFKASAWSTRIVPTTSEAVDASTLRNRLLALEQTNTPVGVKLGADGQSIEVTWRYWDARWLDLMRVNRAQRTHRLVLALDASRRLVRVREYFSAFDASAGAGGLRLEWRAATGMQFFQVEHQRTFGLQLGADGKPTGDWSNAYTFNLQELKSPVIEAVTRAGWTWQPVMWTAPAALRWLTE